MTSFDFHGTGRRGFDGGCNDVMRAVTPDLIRLSLIA